MRQSVVAGLFATGALAFAPAPIRWAAEHTKNLVIVPEGFPNNALDAPQMLTVMNEASSMLHGEIPSFRIKPDSTIAMDSVQGCMEASGSKVRINHCTGGSSQKWSWIPSDNGRSSLIQLQGTNRCLDVTEKAGDLNGSPIELRECDSKLSESWQFHEAAFSAQRESSPFMRRLMISSAAVATLVMLTLGAGFLRNQKAREVVMQQGGIPLNIEDGGVSMAPVFASGAQGMTPAVMAVMPVPEDGEGSFARIRKVFGRARNMLPGQANAGEAEAESDKAAENIAQASVTEPEKQAATEPAETGAQMAQKPPEQDPKKDDEEEKENPLSQIKKFGVAGVISYALWEGGFWTIGGAGGVVAYYAAFGHWPDLSNADDSAKVGAEAFAFINLARFAVPLRIGLAVGTAPWVDENIVRRFGLGKGDNSEEASFAEDFKVLAEDGTAIEGLGANTALLKGLATTPLSDGLQFQTKKTFDTVVDGKRHLGVEWSFEVDSVDLKGMDAEQLKAKYGFPLKITGSSSYDFDENGKVKSMKMSTWSVNGDKIEFPMVEASGAPDPSIKGWAEGMLGLVEDGVKA